MQGLAEQVKDVRVDFDSIPAHETDTMARILLKAIAKAFENPAVREDFERWKKEKGRRNETQEKIKAC